MICLPRSMPNERVVRCAESRLDCAVAEDRSAHSGAAWVHHGGSLCVRFVAESAKACRSGLEPGAGLTRLVAARLCVGLREKESRADDDGPLRPCAQSALLRFHADCCGVCGGSAEL